MIQWAQKEVDVNVHFAFLGTGDLPCSGLSDANSASLADEVEAGELASQTPTPVDLSYGTHQEDRKKSDFLEFLRDTSEYKQNVHSSSKELLQSSLLHISISFSALVPPGSVLLFSLSSSDPNTLLLSSRPRYILPGSSQQSVGKPCTEVSARGISGSPETASLRSPPGVCRGVSTSGTMRRTEIQVLY